MSGRSRLRKLTLLSFVLCSDTRRFYGSKEIGMANGDADIAAHSVQEVLEKFDNKITFLLGQLDNIGEQLTTATGDDAATLQTKKKKTIGSIANISLQQALYVLRRN